MSPRLPALYLPHGGGPWPFMDTAAFGSSTMYDKMTAYLAALPASLPATPEAILVISAHWEAPVPTLMTAAAPTMLYDYTGFPPETYQVRWPAPGAPALADRVAELLDAAGIPHAEDPTRGFDHGTFVPLSVAYPRPQIPVLQLSLVRGLDPADHLALGRALAPLRDEGVFIVGSGMSYHNMRGFFRGGATVKSTSTAFDTWLAEVTALPQAERDAKLTAWASAPHARDCHPREEHLLPLMVVAGAAGTDAVSVPYRDNLMGAVVSAIQFG